MWVVKTNNIGIILWQKALGLNGYDKANIIQQTSYGGHVIGGTAYSKNGDLGGNKSQVDDCLIKSL